jgi:S-adenosylmethionine hydrolase
MGLITFMSDFGHRDPYVAAVKAGILAYNHTIPVIDISHDIEPFNIMHAAYVLKSVFRDFPKGSVHLVCVNAPEASGTCSLLAVKLEEHYFVGIDTGLFSMLSDKKPTAIVEIIKDAAFSSAFPEKGALAKAAVALASGTSIYQLGIQKDTFIQKMNRQVYVTNDLIQGHVVHIDHYGNLMTNIQEDDFVKYGKGRAFKITFGRFDHKVINTCYGDADSGDMVVLFNSSKVLEIAINEGDAHTLLGIAVDTSVKIQFSKE